MPKTHEYEIVDVFAESRYAGNQLAIVYVDGREPDDWLQSIANEFGFSETVFLPASMPGTGPVPTRIFTPKVELPFAGHPTLGAAWAVARHTETEEPVLEERAGIMHTWRSQSGDNCFWMRQNPPEFGEQRPTEGLAHCLSLQASDIASFPQPQVVSTGLPFLIVRLASLDSVRRAVEQSRDLSDWLGNDGPLPVLVFATEAEETDHHIHVRMYAASLGITEDPATGSANGCLAAYLLRHGVLAGNPLEATVEQGYEMGRRSVLYVSAETTDGSITVAVGGQVQLVATGSLTE
jgi:trans-2,3-dihydro-3-hydroxyanthranilate isomerase